MPDEFPMKAITIKKQNGTYAYLQGMSVAQGRLVQFGGQIVANRPETGRTASLAIKLCPNRQRILLGKPVFCFFCIHSLVSEMWTGS